jgi:uncharacterized protein YbjT (DUF2867 family)
MAREKLAEAKMILITGATGKTGKEAAKRLRAKGAHVRAIVRNPDKAADLAALGVEIVAGDVGDRDTLAKALRGIQKAVLVLPNGPRQLLLELQFAEAAEAAGVKHLLKLSSMEAVVGAKNPVHQTHLQVEDRIQHSTLAWTMIRPNFYMQNFLANAATIRAQGKFFLPFGAHGKAAMTDVRDVAEVIAHVLTTPGHERRSYEITGPEVLSFAQVAAKLSEALGKPVEYVDMDPAEYRKRLSQFLTSVWHLDAVCDIFAEIRNGYVAPVTNTFRELVGREPTSIAQFIRDHRALFTGP